MTNSVSDTDSTAIASALAQLTAGWTPAPSVHPSALVTAREALAGALLAGSTVDDMLASPLATLTPVAPPELIAELSTLVEQVANSPSDLLAIVRTELAEAASNPTGAPDWARGAQVLDTFGPFRDAGGVLQWVDTIPRASAEEFAFEGDLPFGVFPVAAGATTAFPSELMLGAGSVWFLASLLSSALPSGAFTGLQIAGGTLSCTESLDFANGAYVVPAGATLTLTAIVAAASPASTTGAPAAAANGPATFAPPAAVTIVFTESTAAFEDVADAKAGAYRSRMTLEWTGAQPTASPDLPGVLVPMTASAANLRFGGPRARPGPPTVDSDVFFPGGAAPVTAAAWALPLASTSVSALPEASGAGTARVQLGPGASVSTEVDSRRMPVSRWVLEMGEGVLVVIASAHGPKSSTVYELWPEPNPSTHRSSVVFQTARQFDYVFVSGPAGPLLLTEGAAVAHLDRPTTAGGTRIAFKSDNAVLVLDHRHASTALTLFASVEHNEEQTVSLALQNVLLGVNAPGAMVLAGELNDNGLRLASVSLTFDLRWLLPTLPDPYAASFGTTEIREQSTRSSEELGTLLATTVWNRTAAAPEMSCALLAPGTGDFGPVLPSLTAGFAARSVASSERGIASTEWALLDLSTHVDLLGVALAPELGLLATRREDVRAEALAESPAPADWGLKGMSLAFNGGLVATFALPQVSWEPMESTKFPTGPIYCDPASDGVPLLVMAPDTQQLVPLEPVPVLTNHIANVAAGAPFAAVFSLPFGLEALVLEPNRPPDSDDEPAQFIAEGGSFRRQIPEFPSRLTGGVALTITAPDPRNRHSGFTGLTVVDPAGYGTTVLSSDVATIFDGDFSGGVSDLASASAVQLVEAIRAVGVPVRRIDFSGYGASIFSDWNNRGAPPPAVIKVQFETTVGRTAYEVIQAESILYPYCVVVIRTITMVRQDAGWVQRSDTGWVAHSNGLMDFPGDQQAAYAGRVNTGPFLGAFNVRNIVDSGTTVTAAGFTYAQVSFDANLGIDPDLKVRRGGFRRHIRGIHGRTALVASKDLVGYVQISPDGTAPPPSAMAELFAREGPFEPQIACVVEAGAFDQGRGARLRASAFMLGTITRAAGGGATPAFGVAMLAAPRIPRAGGWSLGSRPYTSPAPTPLPNDYPVPLVRPASSDDYWYIADVADLLDLAQPDTYYSLIHSTGANKVLFESPRIPTSASVNPPPTGPGWQFPKPPPPRTGGAPGNPGSPNLGDLAAVLNSSGLFPDLANALSLNEGTEQIRTTARGFHYVKRYLFDAGQQSVVVDLGSLMKVTMQYADTTSPSGPEAATLVYRVNSARSPSWRLRIGPLSFIVVVPAFGTDPVLTVKGHFYGDEFTKPGLTKLNVQFGGVLNIVKNVMSDLQALAQFLPGGASAQLDVAVSGGKLTVSETFTIDDIPLGLGDLSNVSLDISLAVQLAPSSVDFLVGIGSQDNPFDWTVTPLAGNGMIALGVQNSSPAFIIQAGIGLGLAIDLGIASGSASVTIAVELDVNPPTITLMAILTGQASVDVLDGLASASITLSAGLGFSLDPIVPPVHFLPPGGTPDEVQIGPETITLLATCSVGIHISLCWVLSISWDGSWQFSQSVNTPVLTVGV